MTEDRRPVKGNVYRWDGPSSYFKARRTKVDLLVTLVTPQRIYFRARFAEVGAFGQQVYFVGWERWLRYATRLRDEVVTR